jgi:hypothetical protein
LSSGDIVLIDVTQKLSSESLSGLEVTAEVRNAKTASPDKRIITAMKWVVRQDGTVSDPVLRKRSIAHFN